VLLLEHRRQERTGGQERGGEVSLDHLAPVGGGFVRGGDGHAVAAGESRENVDRSELLGDGLAGVADVGLDGAIGTHRDRPAAVGADAVADDGEGVLVAGHDGDTGTAGCQGVGGGCSDAAGAAGHDGDLVGQVGIARAFVRVNFGHGVLPVSGWCRLVHKRG
jgi:hypothetical protein